MIISSNADYPGHIPGIGKVMRPQWLSQPVQEEHQILLLVLHRRYLGLARVRPGRLQRGERS